MASIGGFEDWTNVSDGRFKKNISENVKGLDFINRLRPVTYNLDVTGLKRFLKEEDSENMPESVKKEMTEAVSKKEKEIKTGFIAQEVEAAAKESGYDFSGVDKPQNEESLYGLRYGEFTVPLVKAVQELSKKNEEVKSENENLKSEMAAQKSEIQTLKSQITALQSAIQNPQSTITNDGAVRIAPSANETSSPMLGQNVPNPFDNSTVIPFRIPKNCNSAAIMITETGAGKVITVIPVSCNETHVLIESAALASGTYTYSLYVDGVVVDTKQMVLVK